MRWTVAVFPVLALSIMSSGCGESPKPAAQGDAVGAPHSADPTNQAEPAPSAEAVTVEVKDFDGIQKLIASKRGKVVVMDCWSTWCDPCVKEFPGLVELHKKYGPDELACISLSFNYEGGKRETPEEHVEGVLDFLRSQGAAFDNIVASVPSEELYQRLKFKSATVPAIFVYDREGEIAKRFESADATYREVGKLVAELIEARPADSTD